MLTKYTLQSHVAYLLGPETDPEHYRTAINSNEPVYNCRQVDNVLAEKDKRIDGLEALLAAAQEECKTMFVGARANLDIIAQQARAIETLQGQMNLLTVNRQCGGV